MVTALIGGAVKISTTYTLCGNPVFGIKGAPISTTACYAVIAVLNLCVLAAVLGKSRPRYLPLLCKPRAGCGTDGRVRSLRLSFSAHGGRSFPAVGCSGRNCARRQFLCFSGPPSAHGHTGRSRVDSKRRKNCKNPAHSLKNAPPAGICVGFYPPGGVKRRYKPFKIGKNDCKERKIMVDFEFREHYTIDDLRRIVAHPAPPRRLPLGRRADP